MQRMVLVVVMLVVGCGLAFAENVELSCEEYVRLTGTEMNCEGMPTMKMDQTAYDAAQRAAGVRECKDAVHARYPGVDCQPLRLTDTEQTEAHRCYEALLACEKAGKGESAEPKGGEVKLW
jgi:hypothetical protein